MIIIVAITTILITLVILLCLRWARQCRWARNRAQWSTCPCTPGLFESDEVASPLELVNVPANHGLMAASPQPDVASCYWKTDRSQDEVDQINRLNVADIITPLVASRTNLMQGCFCRCGGDIIGKTVYD